MAFKVGQSGNPVGRPKGSKSKISKETRAIIHEIVIHGLERLPSDLKKLSPSSRVRVLVDLLPYDLSRLQNTTIKSDLENLSKEQMEFLVESLIKKMEANV